MSRLFRLEWEDGDWCQLYMDRELVHEGADIPPWVWENLLRKLGVEVVTKYDLRDDRARRGADNWSLVDHPGGSLHGVDPRRIL